MLADDAKAHPWVVVSSVRPRMQTPERHAAYQARHVAYRSLGQTIPPIIAGTPREPVRYLLVASRLSSSFQRVFAIRHGFYPLEIDWTRTPPRTRPLRIAASRAKVAAPVSAEVGDAPAGSRGPFPGSCGFEQDAGVEHGARPREGPGAPLPPVAEAVDKPLARGE